jgi:hypothetical protein
MGMNISLQKYANKTERPNIFSIFKDYSFRRSWRSKAVIDERFTC